tara:strand:- start:288 stop:422 length:135 start_codon:yes stop_codon:yes gene_type:complete
MKISYSQVAKQKAKNDIKLQGSVLLNTNFEQKCLKNGKREQYRS